MYFSVYIIKVRELVVHSLEAIVKNIQGPRLYLKRYIDYFYLLDGTATESLEKYLATDPPPMLKECGARIKKYDNLRREIFLFRNKIPLNMLEIDCTELNELLRTILRELRSTICDNYLEQVRSNNREVCASFDEIAERIAGEYFLNIK